MGSSTMKPDLWKFCYSQDVNDHVAYPRSLVLAPPSGWSYRATTIHFDERFGRPWAHFDVVPGEVIHASSLIPTNSKIPWILDTDHIEYLLMQSSQHFGSSKETMHRTVAEEKIISGLTSTDCKHIIAWSEASKNSIIDLCSRYGVPPPKTTVLYPAVVEPTSNKTFPPSEHVSKLMRRLSPNSIKLLTIDAQLGICYESGRKNISTAVQCYQHLRSLNYPVELIVIGSTEDIRVNDKGLHFLPRLTRADLWKLYREADILLFLSRQDSFGYVLMEAMYNGLCCIATNGNSLPAVRELIDHKHTGFLVNYLVEANYPGMSCNIDMEELITCAELSVASREIRQKVGQAARQSFMPDQRFSVQNRNHLLAKIALD